MPDLVHSLPSKDLGFLRIIASLWGVELTSADPATAAAELAEALCDAGLVEEVVSTLPAAGREALGVLAGADGRMSWVNFARRFGEVREMGAGRRDREQPHLHPVSAAEMLWYRALIAKSFFETEKGPQEFAYIPDDLLMALDFAGMQEDKPELPAEKSAGRTTASKNEMLGRPASPAEKAVILPANDGILDDACTFLAALRKGIEPPKTGIPVHVLHEFLSAAGILANDIPQPEPVRRFLETERSRALEILSQAWQESETFNELRLLPGLAFEGEWKNQPQETREFLLSLLEPIPENQWWSLPAFIRDIKQKYPDYQRPAGDYDSWFIKRSADGLYLRGFESWDEVDGAFIRYFITGPLFWLGLVDLASPEESAAPTAFRNIHRPAKPEDGKLTVTSQGRITIPRLVPRAARYQIARFCEWDEEKADEYRFRVTVNSLEQARKQGLKADQLVVVLRKHAAAPIPPPFIRALQRWETNGTEAKLENLVVLKVSKPDVLKELKTSKAGRFLGEPLGPTTVVIKPGAEAKVLAALAELGLLTELIQAAPEEK
jgi:Helicase conserved C-terminal domain